MVWVALAEEAPHSSPWTFAIFVAELRGKLDRRDRADGWQQPKHDGIAEVVILEGHPHGCTYGSRRGRRGSAQWKNR